MQQACQSHYSNAGTPINAHSNISIMKKIIDSTVT
jgi:hypothetical protein